MASLKVIRTFHPIGQGGFYTERHNKFNIVYDCGSIPRRHADSVVKSAFSKKEVIHALFISHFDYDHISAIATLIKSVHSIRTVIIPLLADEHRNVLVNINRTLSLNILRMIDSPESFFGKHTNIIRVRSGQSPDTDEGDDPIDLIELTIEPSLQSNKKNSNTITINSGRPLTLGRVSKWVFVPYNYKYRCRHTKLVEELKLQNFNVKKLQTDSAYTIHEIVKPAIRRKIRKVYDSLDGTVNENSMLLYSGPSKIVNKGRVCGCKAFSELIGYSDSCLYLCKAGCIYTGDCDLKRIELSNIYSSYKKYVGVVQVPHHGSKHSFDLKSLDGFTDLICPVSYGTKNRYGHPSAEVVKDLFLSPFQILSINENPNSKFEQIFDCPLELQKVGDSK